MSKQNVVTTPKPVIKSKLYLEDLSDNSIIGVSDLDGVKGFLTRSKFEGGQYILLATTQIQKGNCWGEDDCNLDTFFDVIEHIRYWNLDVYVFDTVQELFRWLAE